MSVLDFAARRLLLVRTDAIGDGIIASSMLSHYRASFPQAEITIACRSHVAALYEACPFVDHIVSYDDARIRVDAVYREGILSSLAAEAFDLALNSVYSRDPVSELLAVGCGARVLLGCSGDLSNLSEADRVRSDAAYTMLVRSTPGWMTEIDRHAEFLAGIGIEAERLAPEVWTTQEDEAFADDLLSSLGIVPGGAIAVFPGAQDLFRHWDGMASVLRETSDVPVLVLGASSDAAESAGIVAALGARAHDLAGTTTIRQTIALIRRSRVCLSTESAGVHIACAVRVPNVCIVGGGHFGRFMPYSGLTTAVTLPLACFRCGWHCPYRPQMQCVSRVDPLVAAAALRLTLERDHDRPLLVMQADASALRNTARLARFRRGPLRRGDVTNLLCTPCDVMTL